MQCSRNNKKEGEVHVGFANSLLFSSLPLAPHSGPPHLFSLLLLSISTCFSSFFPLVCWLHHRGVGRSNGQYMARRHMRCLHERGSLASWSGRAWQVDGELGLSDQALPCLQQRRRSSGMTSDGGRRLEAFSQMAIPVGIPRLE